MTDKRDLRQVLRAELAFLENGGYRRQFGTAWRPPFIFEDSPACANHDRKEDQLPCAECVLIRLMSPESRQGKAACRHIPLNFSGETLNSLYRYGDQHEIEEIYGNWLKRTIERFDKFEDADDEREPRAIVRFFSQSRG